MDDINKFSIDKSDIRPSTFTIQKEPVYVCPIHVDAGWMRITNDQVDHVFCLKCYVEKLDEIGVCRVEEKV